MPLTTPASPPPSPPTPPSSGPRAEGLLLGALGVVFGDIGTSPLYALRECLEGAEAATLAERAMGSASLIFWSLTLLVSFKYLYLVLRADNHGEGGVLALMALASRRKEANPRLLAFLGAFGAALLYGDGILTPAVTVLGALEGLDEAWPAAAWLAVPGTVLVLALVFLSQRHAAGRFGACFGPVMVVWFATLAILGTASVLRSPEVLRALSPGVGLRYLATGGAPAYALLGSVFLAVTGAEALYADLGLFGRRPIRTAWLVLVFPALSLNYLGQAALVLRDATAIAHPFYRLAPPPLQLPLLLLALLAGIVVCQALVSGAFSVTMQALQLGFLPRLNIEHTSVHQQGRIHVGVVNALLAIGCIGSVLLFGRATDLAGAYGVAVAMTMVLTTILLGAIARHRWQWSLPRCAILLGTFFVADLAFLGSNLLKFPGGGWLPLALGLAVFVAMITWHRGRETLGRRMRNRSIPLDEFIQQVEASTSIRRVSGTAIFLSGTPDATPVALLHNLKHNHVVHERVIVLRFESTTRPHSDPERRVEIAGLPAGFWRVTARFGFMEDPSLAAIQPLCAARGLAWDDMDTTYFLGRETIVASRHPLMPRWQSRLFRLLSRNAQQPAAFYRLPPNRVVELGVQTEI